MLLFLKKNTFFLPHRFQSQPVWPLSDLDAASAAGLRALEARWKDIRYTFIRHK